MWKPLGKAPVPDSKADQKGWVECRFEPRDGRFPNGLPQNDAPPWHGDGVFAFRIPRRDDRDGSAIDPGQKRVQPPFDGFRPYPSCDEAQGASLSQLLENMGGAFHGRDPGGVLVVEGQADEFVDHMGGSSHATAQVVARQVLFGEITEPVALSRQVHKNLHGVRHHTVDVEGEVLGVDESGQRGG